MNLTGILLIDMFNIIAGEDPIVRMASSICILIGLIILIIFLRTKNEM